MANRHRQEVLAILPWAFGATWVSMVWAVFLRGAWGGVSVWLLCLAGLWFGLWPEGMSVWEVTVGILAAVLVAGRAWRWDWPSVADVLRRLDHQFPTSPIATACDYPAQDLSRPALAIWQAHRAKAIAQLRGARPMPMAANLAARDPFGLRLIALLAFALAAIFGTAPAPKAIAATGQAGLRWEAWISAPEFANHPVYYLADIKPGPLELLENTTITWRIYDRALRLEQTVGTINAPPDNALTDDLQTTITVEKSGMMRIDGVQWDVRMLRDRPPVLTPPVGGHPRDDGGVEIPVRATDDIAMQEVIARITLADPHPRNHGLAVPPDPLPPVHLATPGHGRAEITTALRAQLSRHPWAHLPVDIEIIAEDGAGQTDRARIHLAALPARRFFDPFSAAVIEQRRDLLWAEANGARVAMILRAISAAPEDLGLARGVYPRLRETIAALETAMATGRMAEARDEIADALWDVAVLQEERDLEGALAQLEDAQRKLAQAMKNGASPAEIDRLMQALNQATQSYLEELAQQGADGDVAPEQGEALRLQGDDLAKMMAHIQELMKQGRMAEAEQALKELTELMAKMQVTQGGAQGRGRSAAKGVQEIFRAQRDLADEAFRGVQNRFVAPELREAESATAPRSAEVQARAQRDLSQKLAALRAGLVPPNGDEGAAMMAALAEAQTHMDGAAQALERADFLGALDPQAQTLQALREALRAMARAQPSGDEGARDDAPTMGETDPLGRARGGEGDHFSEDGALGGGDVYREARDILRDIRRRSADPERSQGELDYLRRLMQQF